MRRHLIAALAGLAIFTLAAYVTPRTFITAVSVRDQQKQNLERLADLVEAGLAADGRGDAPEGFPKRLARFEALLHDDEQVTLERTDGTVAVAGSTHGDTYATRRELPDGSVLTVELSSRAIAEDVGQALAPAMVIAFLAMTVAVVLAVVLARRLVRPFVDLATYAEELTEEDAGPAPRAGMAESDDLAEALERGHAHVKELLQRERQFSANASHQLRTPLAAVRLRLEDLATWDEVTPEVRAELGETLGEVERLSAIIADLLELARSGGLGTWADLDIGHAATVAVERWRPLFDEVGRRLVIRPGAAPAVAATSQRGLQQVFDVVLDNALVHGRGRVDVSVHPMAGNVVVRVQDDGRFDHAAEEAPRSFHSATRTGSGIGLSLAQTIAETAGARLYLASADPTRFEIRLPTAERRSTAPVEVGDALVGTTSGT